MPLLCGAARGAPGADVTTSVREKEKEYLAMNIALLIVVIVAIVLAIVGGLNAALNWLLWVAIIVGLLALIAFLFRVLSGRRSV
jgi:uncharacterized Tic20 family protein